MKLSRVKGTRDLLPPETKRWDAVEEIARRIFSSYGYGEIRTPALEPTELFVRSVGETTDIVHKEMYTFLDRGERSLTLRPENTAGVVRAVVENHLDQGPMPLRLFYIGPQYRYERPQKGRYREFRQIGAELFGSALPAADAELLIMLFEFLRALGFLNLSVSLNAVPGKQGREQFSSALREFASGFRDRLGDDDLRRLEQNPLRLFDSKDPETAKALQDAPRAVDFLDSESASHHRQVIDLLSAAGIPHVENRRLVRGLDYYTKTVFEVTSTDLGAQDAILGGGRYDNLVKDLGGPDLPAVGFAIGEDRLVDIVPGPIVSKRTLVVVSAVPPESLGYALEVAREVRRILPGAIVRTDVCAKGWAKQLGWTSKELSTDRESSYQNGFAVLIGPEEARAREVIVKDLSREKQEKVALAELRSSFARLGAEGNA